MLKLLTPNSSIKELQRQRFTEGFFLNLVNAAYPAFLIASSVIDQCSVDQLMYELVSCLYDDEKAVQKKIEEKIVNAAITSMESLSTIQCYRSAMLHMCIYQKKISHWWKSSFFKRNLDYEEIHSLIELLQNANNFINVFQVQGHSIRFRESEKIIIEKNRMLNNIEVSHQPDEMMLSDASIIALMKQDDIWLRSKEEIKSIETTFSFYHKICQERMPHAWIQRLLKKLNYYN